jgi:hypothetical protein
MQISKAPQADASVPRMGTAAQTSTAKDSESSTATVISVNDFADIRPLDVVAALQILVAEVRAGLDASLEGPTTPGAVMQNPIQAARELLDMFLRALPEDASDASAWTAALIPVETAVQARLERAVSVVAAWRDTPPNVVDAAKQTRMLFLAALGDEALGDEAQNLWWLRPEWMGLGAPLARFRRRRRAARRRLADPDYPVGNLDDESVEIRR